MSWNWWWRAGDVMGCIENCFPFFLFFFCDCRFGEFSIIIRYSSCFSFMFRFFFFFRFHGDAHNNKTRHYSMHHRVYRRFCFKVSHRQMVACSRTLFSLWKIPFLFVFSFLFILLLFVVFSQFSVCLVCSTCSFICRSRGLVTR